MGPQAAIEVEKGLVYAACLGPAEDASGLIKTRDTRGTDNALSGDS